MKNHDSLYPDGYENLSLKEKMNLGILDRHDEFAVASAARVDVVLKWLPRLILANKVLTGVSLLSFLLALFWALRSYPPIVLLTFPDGKTVCAPRGVDPETHQRIPRENPEEVDLCQRLNIGGGEEE